MFCKLIRFHEYTDCKARNLRVRRPAILALGLFSMVKIIALGICPHSQCLYTDMVYAKSALRRHFVSVVRDFAIMQFLNFLTVFKYTNVDDFF